MTAETNSVKVIFDTDMESDVDDVGALALLHGLVSDGRAELLAVMLCGTNKWSAGCAGSMNAFYGRPHIPLGRVGAHGVYMNSTYACQIAEEFAPGVGVGQNVEDAIALYRKTLASQPDNSVVIITVGYLTNLRDLLMSQPDDYSALSGEQLVAKKVLRYACMGSRYPADTDTGTGRWGNFRPDPESARYVAAHWPGVITFTGGGDFSRSIPAGKELIRLNPTRFPVSRAYRLFFEKIAWAQGPDHHTADLITVYVGVFGADPVFKTVTHGHNVIDDIGRNAWQTDHDNPNHEYVSALADPAQAAVISDMLEAYALRPPQGLGLKAEYFNDISLSHPVLERIDAEIDFDWGADSPGDSIDADAFSARWSGGVVAPQSGECTFYAETNGGVRLWLDERLLVDEWNSGSLRLSQATVSLNAGARCAIRVEYCKNNATAAVRLLWSWTDTAKSVVTFDHFRLT